MEYFSAGMMGALIGFGIYGLVSVFASLNELRDIVGRISDSTEKIKAVSARIEQKYG